MSVEQRGMGGADMNRTGEPRDTLGIIPGPGRKEKEIKGVPPSEQMRVNIKSRFKAGEDVCTGCATDCSK